MGLSDETVEQLIDVARAINVSSPETGNRLRRTRTEYVSLDEVLRRVECERLSSAR